MSVSPIVKLSTLGVMLAMAALPVQAENAAHDIANRFSDAPAIAAPSQDEAQRKAYEAEMLERARQEARDAAVAEARAEAQSEQRIRELEAQREAEAKALADKLKRADEARKARVADAPDDKPFKPALTNSDKSLKPAAGQATAPIVVSPPPVAPSKSADIAKDLPSTPAVAKSESKAASPADNAAPARQTPSSPPVVAPTPDMPVDVAREPPKVLPPPMALGRPMPPVAVEPADNRVTILLVMEPGNKGIRRFNKTADPVICEDQVCFISNGAAEPSRVMPLRKALGPGNTFGKRAGACRGKLTCVFRGLTLAGTAPIIQPVDLKVMVHDRRESRTVSGDASCRVVASRLACGRTVVARGYRAWIVPEAIAQEAGPAALEAAVMRGLVANPLREAAFTR